MKITYLVKSLVYEVSSSILKFQLSKIMSITMIETSNLLVEGTDID